MRTFIISCNKAENIFVSQHRCLIDFHFAIPRTFLARMKYLDGDIFFPPRTTPDLAKTALTYELFLANLTSNRPLYQQRTS